MEVFFSIVGIIWGILCIILFFKVWGMCNNVNEIKNILQGKFVGKDENGTKDLDDVYSKSDDEKLKELAIYVPENMTVEILGKEGGNVYKCRSIKDGQIYYFKKDVLNFV